MLTALKPVVLKVVRWCEATAALTPAAAPLLIYHQWTQRLLKTCKWVLFVESEVDEPCIGPPTHS